MTQDVFLLSYTKYGDHDAVLHCFCKENGYESFFAKGIYNPKNKKKAFLFPLNALQLQVSDKSKSIRNIMRLEQISNNLFTEDIRKNSILFFVADLLNQILRHENQNRLIYHDIALFLEELQNDNFESHLVFAFLMLRRMGLQPLLSNQIFLNPETGNFEVVETHPFFDEEVSVVWRALLESENPYVIKLKRQTRQNFLRSVMVYFQYHLTGFYEPKSLEVIKDIF